MDLQVSKMGKTLKLKIYRDLKEVLLQQDGA